MKKYILLSFIFIANFLFSQKNNDFTSFNGSFSVAKAELNEADGKAYVEIPLFNIKSGNIEIPIKLQYNTGGIKVNQRAGNVGLGWSLADITIARDIQDAHDMDDGGAVPKIRRTGYFKKVKKNIKYFFSSTDKDSANLDYLPDLYFLNSINKKHVFYFENENMPRLLSDRPIKISKLKETRYEVDGFPTTDFFNFTINTDDGIQYQFNDYEMANYYNSESPVNVYGGIIDRVPYVSSWKVSKIKDLSTNREVSFEYIPSADYNITSTSHSREIRSETYSRFKALPGTSFISDFVGKYVNAINPDIINNGVTGLQLSGFLSANPFLDGGQKNNTSYKYNKIESSVNYFKTKDLKKIVFDEGYLIYEYDFLRQDTHNTEKALSSIKLYDYNNKLVQQYNFNYGYFLYQNTWMGISTKDGKSLKLLSIEEVNSGKKYQFKYKDDEYLPNIRSKAYDYGGYYKETNEFISGDNYGQSYADNVYYYPDQMEWSLLPFEIHHDALVNNNVTMHPIHYGDNYITRDPDLDFTKIGTLTEIEFPNKGIKSFEYELNDFLILGDYQKAPGLRIKKINNIDENQVKSTISYFYKNENGSSSGVMMNPPFIGYPRAQLFTSYIDISAQPPMLITNYNGLPNFAADDLQRLFKIYDSPGNINIQYSRVEKIIDNKKQATEYTTVKDYPLNNTLQSPFAMLQFSQDGFATFFHKFSIAEFLNTNSAYRLKYNSYTNPDLYGVRKNTKLFDKNNALIKEYIYDNKLTIKNQFGPNKPILDFIIESGSQTYSNTIISSQGSIIVNYIQKYLRPVRTTVKDYLLSGTNTDRVEYKYLNPSGYLSGIGKLLAVDIYSSGSIDNVLVNDIFYPEDEILSTVPTLNLENTVNLLKSINKVNVPVLTYEYIDIELVNTSEANSKVHKTIFAKDASTSNLVLPKYEYECITRPGWAYETTHSQEDVKVMTYDLYDDKGNLLQYTGKDGIATTILYGYNQTRPIAKIQGASYDIVMNALGLASGSNPVTYLSSDIVKKSNLDKDSSTEDIFISALTSLRNNNLLKNYQITTMAYDPIIGITHNIPPSGITQKYIYDSAGRLIKIEDMNGKPIKEFEYNYKH